MATPGFSGNLTLNVHGTLYVMRAADKWQRKGTDQYVSSNDMEGLVGRREVLLAKDFHFVRRNGRKVTACRGLSTDGASVPEAFRWIFWRFGALIRASLIHDSCYVTRRYDGVAGGRPEMDRKEADDIFLEGLKRTRKAGGLDRTAVYGAVRGFGDDVWRARWGEDGI